VKTGDVLLYSSTVAQHHLPGIRDVAVGCMYPVREVLFLVVLAGPEVLNEYIRKCPDLARRKSPGGAHDVEAALRRRMTAERETLFVGMPVWALLTATPSRHLIREIRSNIA
jgi:hypothetical protein